MRENPVPAPLGLPRGTVRVVAYHPGWPASFADEKTRLSACLNAKGLVVTIEHTGSTAVPGLVAKPIIDVLLGWEREDAREEVVAALALSGYSYRGEEGVAGRDFFRRGDPPSFHVHSTKIGSTFWCDHLDFRNFLRTRSAAANEYGQLKSALAIQFANDRASYIEAKTLFVRAALVQARQTGTRSVGSAAREASAQQPIAAAHFRPVAGKT